MQSVETHDPDLYKQDGSIFQFVRTYVIVALLLFFAMGGLLPSAGSVTSSLQIGSNPGGAMAGTLFQGGAWLAALILMASSAGAICREAFEAAPLAALSVLGPVSAIWSLDPADSLRRGVFLVLCTLFAFFLVRTWDAPELGQMMVLAGLIVGVASIAVSVFVPGIGRDIRNGMAWQGVFGSKNACAEGTLFLLSATVSFRPRDRNDRCLIYSLYLVSLVLVVMSKAKTSWVLTVLLIAFTIWYSKLRTLNRQTMRFVVVSTIGFICVAACVLFIEQAAIFQLLGKEATVSGRVPLWLGVWEAIEKRPFLGYGYDAFWHQGLKGEPLNIYALTHFEIFQAQNGFLEIWLELGLGGLLLILVMVAQTIRNAIACFRDGEVYRTRWFISILILTLAYNTVETFFVEGNSLPWLMFLIAYIGLAREAARVRTSTVIPSEGWLAPRSLQ